MSEEPSNQAWQLLGDQVTWRAGFAHGVRYPSVTLIIRGEELSENEIDSLAHGLITALPAPELLADWTKKKCEALKAGGDAKGIVPVAHLLLLAMAHLQREAGLPVFEVGCILSHRGAQAELLVPTTVGTYGFIGQIMRWLVHACGLYRAECRLEGNNGELKTLLDQLQSQFGTYSATFQFVAAAMRAGIPFVELPDKVIQYGQGHLTSRMLYSMTDATSNIAVHLSRKKHCAAQIMAEAGLPVAAHQLVDSEATALQAADVIGYPVVVKPADRDGGKAVSADLRTPEEVANAFGSARAASENVLVEKHVPGRDYRLTVLHGKVIWAIERVPGGIMGDGRASVRDLIEQQNNDPRRRPASHAPLRPVLLDNEARLLLDRCGLTESSVPAAGHFIALRRAANIATGGTPVPAFEMMHPDNAQLAVRAAAALRLDMAGIDLLIPDISHSWRETGAAICEVNAGPDIGQTTSLHLYGPILSSLVKGSGRIPTILVLGSELDSPLDQLMRNGLRPSGMMIGYHDRLGTRVGNERLTSGPVSCFMGGRMLIRDNRVEALIMQINENSLLTSGLPFPRYDLLIIAGCNLTAVNEEQSRTGNEIALELISALLPGCDGKVMKLQGVELQLDAIMHMIGEKWRGILNKIDLNTQLLSEIEFFIDKHG